MFNVKVKDLHKYLDGKPMTIVLMVSNNLWGPSQVPFATLSYPTCISHTWIGQHTHVSTSKALVHPPKMAQIVHQKFQRVDTVELKYTHTNKTLVYHHKSGKQYTPKTLAHVHMQSKTLVYAQKIGLIVHSISIQYYRAIDLSKFVTHQDNMPLGLSS